MTPVNEQLAGFRRFRDWLPPLVLALLLAWVGSGVLAAHLLTSRARPRFDEPPPLSAVPFEPLRLRTRDGLELGAWKALTETPRASVVLVHGNGASRSSLVAQAEWFHARGCHVLPLSVRAHGDSDGEVNDIGWSARHDVIAAVDHFEPLGAPIVVFGNSLGAAAAVFAGSELGARVQRLERYLFTPLDTVAYGAMMVGARVMLPDLDSIRPSEHAAHLAPKTATLVFAGAADDRAPPEDALRIARASRGRAIVLPGLDHEAMGNLVDRPEWEAAVSELLERVAGSANRTGPGMPRSP
jgi:uncharacterized protein